MFGRGGWVRGGVLESMAAACSAVTVRMLRALRSSIWGVIVPDF